MEIKPVNFYLHTQYWVNIESSLSGHRSIFVRDHAPDDIVQLVDKVFNADPDGVVLLLASPAGVPEYINGPVDYAVFKDFGEGVLTLIGWFDRKPAYWPGRCE